MVKNPNLCLGQPEIGEQEKNEALAEFVDLCGGPEAFDLVVGDIIQLAHESKVVPDELMVRLGLSSPQAIVICDAVASREDSSY